MSEKEKSAKLTLKNTSLVGGAQLIRIIIQVIKTKFIAIFLGPAGIGLIQLFTSTLTLVQSISGLGLGFSGVREIADGFGKKDEEKIAKSIGILQKWSFVAGFVGILLTTIFSKKLSVWTFGSEEYWIEISILSVVIILTNMSMSYSAVIQGVRKMNLFAKINILGAFFGAIVAVIVYYFLREKGILPVMILSAVIVLCINVYYYRTLGYRRSNLSPKKVFFGGLSMVELGLFTVITGFIAQITLYYVRVSINTNLGTEYVGFYSVATEMAINYMGLVFAAMSADYFPKLSSINTDNKALNVAVIEQTKIILLLGCPLIIIMYTFSEYVIQILYTSEFLAALPLLMWLLLSVFLRLIAFPIGYVFLAKGKSRIFIFIETLWSSIFIGLTYIFWQFDIGLVGVGIAFTSAYVIYLCANIFLIKGITQFRYDKKTLVYITLFSVVTLIYFLSSIYNLDSWLIFGVKIIGVLIFGIYCLKELEKLVGINIVKLIINKFKK